MSIVSASFAVRRASTACGARWFAALLVLACACGVLPAQTTAPQLLPYTSKLIAGGGTAQIAAGATCPVSGFTSTDNFGDGCVATEIEIGNNAASGATPGARGAVADANGNVFFTDYSAGLVRRVDASTGIVTAVAGGGTAAAGTSSGLTGTAVKLLHPAGITFAPNGDLYFSDPGNGQVFKVAATNGLIATTGVISLVAGNASAVYGYAASNPTTTVTLVNSYLRAVYGLAFDALGDLYMADEYYYTITALNTNTSGSNTVFNTTIPAGQIWKIVGAVSGSSYCLNGQTNSSGCTSAVYTSGVQANSDEVRGVYSVAIAPNGNLYSGEEYYNSVFTVNPAGVLNNFAGIPNNAAKKITRAPAGSFGIGSVFGLTVDGSSNVYFTDASNGVIWRVDAVGNSQYVVAGGASAVCAGATDAYGDGCPALQAKMGSSGSGNFATTTLPGPGVYAVSVDTHEDLFFGDTETNLVREIASGTQFGSIGANQAVTQTLDIHFAANDAPLSYTLTAGSTYFTLGTAACTANSDATTDCLLPVTALDTALGAFSGTLQVKSTQGGVGTFALSGISVSTPVTRISVAASAPSVTGCGSTNTYSTSTPIQLTATIVSSGSPTGTVTFFANGTQVGTPQAITNGVSTLTTTLSSANTYKITATYSGDSYFHGSTTATAATVIISGASFTATANAPQQSTVVAGQTALYSFNLAASVYTGTIGFTCSGLPTSATCMFSPQTITAAGCSGTSTVGLSILTQQTTVNGVPSGSGFGGRGPWGVLGLALGAGLALAVGVRRRRLPRLAALGMALVLLAGASGLAGCGHSLVTPRTPAGSYTVLVTATGSTGLTSSFTVPLVVQ